MDRRTARRNTRSRPSVDRLDAHPAHQCRHVPAADHMPFPAQSVGELAGTVKG
jgi:hypothetical protein